MSYAPGPFKRDAMPFGPRVSHDGLFAALVEPVANVLRGSEPVLKPAQDTVGRDVPDNIDATYATTVGDAEYQHAIQVSAGPLSEAAVLHDAGDGVDAHHAYAQPFLPSPDTPVQTGFVEPPPEARPGDPDDQSAYRHETHRPEV